LNPDGSFRLGVAPSRIDGLREFCEGHFSLRSVRVLMLGMPIMLRQILRSVVVGIPGVSDVTELPHNDLRSPEVLVSGADLVIVGDEEASEEEIAALLRRHRRLRVLAVSSQGTSGFLYEMTPSRTRIEELSHDAVTDAVLRAMSDAQAPGSANGV